MYDCVYIHHENIEKTCNELLKFLKYNSDIVDNILIVTTSISPDDEYLLKCIYPLKIVTPLQFENLKNSYKRTLNISTHFDEKSGKRACISYYVYYTQFLTEGLNFINKFKEKTEFPVDLYIQVPSETEMNYTKTKCGQILTSDVDVFFNKVENRGRDVLPFLQLINSESYKRYDYICKVHTKKNNVSRFKLENKLF